MPQVRLRVRRRLVLAKDGFHTSSECVFCPKRSRSVDIGACRNCAHAILISAESVVCCVPVATPPGGADAAAASVALRDVTIVRADVPGSEIADRLREEPWPLPVVDNDDHFLGFASLGLIERPKWPWQAPETLAAREVLVGASLFAFESESLGNVLRIMARRGSRFIALVDGSSGAVQGILFDVDALQALAPMGRAAAMSHRG